MSDSHALRNSEWSPDFPSTSSSSFISSAVRVDDDDKGKDPIKAAFPKIQVDLDFVDSTLLEQLVALRIPKTIAALALVRTPNTSLGKVQKYLSSHHTELMNTEITFTESPPLASQITTTEFAHRHPDTHSAPFDINASLSRLQNDAYRFSSVTTSLSQSTTREIKITGASSLFIIVQTTVQFFQAVFHPERGPDEAPLVDMMSLFYSFQSAHPVDVLIDRRTALNPVLTIREFTLLQSLMLRTLYQLRPENFVVLEKNPGPNADLEIYTSFFRDFLEGPFQIHRARLEKSLGPDAASLMDYLGQFLEHIVNDDLDSLEILFFTIVSLLEERLPAFKSPDELWKGILNNRYQVLIQHITIAQREQWFFQPNALRNFWEGIYRNQQNQALWNLVCQSFDAELQQQEVHLSTLNVWRLSQLDTINEHPQEARTRMPSESSIPKFDDPHPVEDSHTNAGYRIQQSRAYQEWISSNPLVLAVGNVIMDAVTRVIEMGCTLDLEEFLQSFHIYHNWQLHCCSRRPNLSCEECVSFSPPESPSWYLVPTFYRYLIRLMKSLEHDSLARRARSEFEKFQAFSRQLDTHEKSQTAGPVLGIGFNGPLFGVSSTPLKRRDEIWLLFSKSGRKPESGGMIFLHFVRMEAEKSRCFPDVSVLSESFSIYKRLIELNLTAMAKRSETLGPEYADVLSRLEASSDHLHAIEWYHVPRKNSTESLIKIYGERQGAEELSFPPSTDSRSRFSTSSDSETSSPELDILEQRVHRDARNLVFDVMVGRCISKEYPALIPYLFAHWRERILQSDATGVLRDHPRYYEVPDSLKEQVHCHIDRLALMIHPGIRAVWHDAVTDFFKHSTEFQTETRKISDLKRRMDNLQTQIERQPGSSAVAKMNSRLKEAQTHLVTAEAEMRRKISEMPSEEYKRFRERFFENRDISQCVEPLFAKVLGHIYFFPVSISGNKSKAIVLRHSIPFTLGNQCPQPVIPPCSERCQLHVLGHLYMGDMFCDVSADGLNEMRRQSGFGEIVDRIPSVDDIVNALRGTR